MKLTFLEAANGLRLSKHFTLKNEWKPYPHVKNFNSYEHDVTTIEELHEQIIDHAEKGHCLLKGNLTKVLTNQSRAGVTDRAGTSQLLALDFDGISLKDTDQWSLRNIDQDKLANLAEQLIQTLPPELHQVSYIAQASSSIGFKSNTLSMHVFIMLQVPMPPKTIKLWLQNTNYEQPAFQNQIELSVNGQSLKYPLDTSVADNSKLLFIAPPTFDDPEVDPFKSAEDRIVLVTKRDSSLDLGKLVHISPQAIHEKSQKIKNKLRESSGLSKSAEKIKVMQVNYRSEDVLINPDKMSIQIASTNYKPFITCNINGGDSAAYWFHIDNPTYMYNFKGEPIFEIEKADSDFYHSIFDLFKEEMEKTGRPEYPVVFRDFNTDTYWNGIYNPNTYEFESLKPTSRVSIEDFMRTHGRPAPDFIPDADMSFNPTSNDPTVNLDSLPYTINTFKKSPAMLNAIEPADPLELGYAVNIQEQCPTIYTITKHILGNGDQELERFVNWLAYVYQTRKKAKTAWVLSGVPGTGKGVFANHVLRPLFTDEQVPVKTLENLEEQFNSYLQQAIVCVVDEFHMASSGAMQKVANKLKNQITEPTITIRKMRANQVEVPNYTSFIFLTNHVDAMRIEPGDRRYNIAPRQEQKLNEAHPKFLETMDKKIKEELSYFAGYLSTFKYNELLVHTPVENDAKIMMKTNSMSVFEEFCDALHRGDVEYFAEVLDLQVTNIMNSGEIDSAQRFIKNWISHSHAKSTSIVPVDHLKIVFNVYTDAKISLHEFRKRLQRNNLNIVRKRQEGAGRESTPIRGVEVTWKTDELRLQNIINTYFKNDDFKLLQDSKN